MQASKRSKIKETWQITEWYDPRYLPIKTCLRQLVKYEWVGALVGINISVSTS